MPSPIPDNHPYEREMRRAERAAAAILTAALDRMRRQVFRGITRDNVREVLSRLQGRDVNDALGEAIMRALDPVGQMGADHARAYVERELFGVKAAIATDIGFDWTLANTAARERLRRHAFNLYYAGEYSITAATERQLRGYIDQLIATGGSLRDLELQVAHLFAPERAEMIAVTEVTRAYALGNMAAWEASGVVQQKEWGTARDELVCFPAWTMVTTDKGAVPIQNLKPGDKVLTRRGWKPVVATSNRQYKGDMVELQAGKLSVIATGNHPIWKSQQGWLNAREFDIGDGVQTFNDKTVLVRRVFKFFVGNSDYMPAAIIKILGFGCVPFSSFFVPVNAINFQSDSQGWQNKVNRVSTHFSFLDKLNTIGLQNQTHRLFGHCFPIEFPITSKTAKLSVFVTGQPPEFFAAISTRHHNRWTATFLRTIMPVVSFFTVLENNTASFARRKAQVGMPTLDAANRVSVGSTGQNVECFSTNGAHLVYSGNTGQAASVRAKLFAALQSPWRKIKLFLASGASDVFSSSLSLCLSPFKHFRFTRHIAHSMTRLTVLYHKLFANSIRVYDIQVQDVPEFFANGFLVHNCPICAPLNGKRAALDATFDGVVSNPPAHPRCRCFLRPVVDVPEETDDERINREMGEILEQGYDPFEGIRPPPFRAPRGMGQEYADRRAIVSRIQTQMRHRSVLRDKISQYRGQANSRWDITHARARVEELDKAIEACLTMARDPSADWNFKRELIESLLDYVSAITRRQ